jgi:hypothetical protein
MLLIFPNGVEAPYVAALRQEVPELVCFAEYCPIVHTDSADVGKFTMGKRIIMTGKTRISGEHMIAPMFMMINVVSVLNEIYDFTRPSAFESGSILSTRCNRIHVT